MMQKQSFEFEISRYTMAELIASATADYTRGYTCGVYIGRLRHDNGSIPIWGAGRVKNTETLYVSGICHLINEHQCLPECSIPMNIAVLNNGFIKNLRRLTPKWIANGGKNTTNDIPDAFEEWKQCYQLLQLGGMQVDRVTPKKGGEWLAEMKAKARTIITELDKIIPSSASGVVLSGNHRPEGIVEAVATMMRQ